MRRLRCGHSRLREIDKNCAYFKTGESRFEPGESVPHKIGSLVKVEWTSFHQNGDGHMKSVTMPHQKAYGLETPPVYSQL